MHDMSVGSTHRFAIVPLKLVHAGVLFERQCLEDIVRETRAYVRMIVPQIKVANPRLSRVTSKAEERLKRTDCKDLSHFVVLK